MTCNTLQWCSDSHKRTFYLTAVIVQGGSMLGRKGLGAWGMLLVTVLQTLRLKEVLLSPHVVSKVSLEVITSLNQRRESGGVCMRILISSTQDFHSQFNGWHSIIRLHFLVKESETLQMHMRKGGKWFGEQLPSLCHAALPSAVMFHRKRLPLPVQGQTFCPCFESHIFPFLLGSFLLIFPFCICYFQPFPLYLDSSLKLPLPLAKATHKSHTLTSTMGAKSLSFSNTLGPDTMDLSPLF